MLRRAKRTLANCRPPEFEISTYLSVRLGVGATVGGSVGKVIRRISAPQVVHESGRHSWTAEDFELVIGAQLQRVLRGRRAADPGAVSASLARDSTRSCTGLEQRLNSSQLRHRERK